MQCPQGHIISSMYNCVSILPFSPAQWSEQDKLLALRRMRFLIFLYLDLASLLYILSECLPWYFLHYNDSQLAALVSLICRRKRKDDGSF